MDVTSCTIRKLILKISYAEGGIVDKTVEYFSGPHDFMSSWNYQNIDGVTSVIDNSFWTGTVVSGALLIPATPFALAPFTQKYLDSIQNYRYMKKENEQIKEEAISNAKDNR